MAADMKILIDKINQLNESVVKGSEELQSESFNTNYKIDDLTKAITDFHKDTIDALTTIYVTLDDDFKKVNPAAAEEAAADAQKEWEDILQQLKVIAGNTKPVEHKEKEDSEKESSPITSLVLLAAGLGAVLGLVTGAMSGYLKALKSISEPILNIAKNLATKIFPYFENSFKVVRDAMIGAELQAQLWITSLKEFFTKFSEPFKNAAKFGEELISKITNSKFITGIVDFVTNIGTKFEQFFAPLKELMSGASKVGGKISGFVDIIKEFFNIFTTTFETMGKVFSKVFKIFTAIGEKLAFPLTIIMGLYEAITGAIDGYKKDGIIGAIKGAITGALESVVTGLLDMLKDAVSWILDKLGFSEASKFLDSFNFTDIMKEFVDAIFGPIEMIKDLFNKAIDFISNIEIPAIDFTIPIVNKKISLGPWHPFTDKKTETTPTQPQETTPTPPKVEGAPQKQNTQTQPQTVTPQAQQPQEPSKAPVEQPKSNLKVTDVAPKQEEATKAPEGKPALESDKPGMTLVEKKVESYTQYGPLWYKLHPNTPAEKVAQPSEANAAAKDNTQGQAGNTVVSAPQTNNQINQTTVQTKGPIRSTEPSSNKLLSNIYIVG